MTPSGGRKWMEASARSVHQVDAQRIDISPESLISLLLRMRDSESLHGFGCRLFEQSSSIKNPICRGWLQTAVMSGWRYALC